MGMESPPPLTEPGKTGYLSGELIYALEGRPTPQCHASTIVETPAGMVAAWFGGTREKNPDVGIWVSRLKDGTWSKPVEVVNGVQSPDLRYPCWNPVLFQPKKDARKGEDEPLMLFYKVGPNPREWWGMLTLSNDGGETWSRPSRLGENAAVGHLIGPVKNKPIQLTDGAILCPSSSEISDDENEIFWAVHFEITRDLGKTWEVIGPINDGIEFDAIQPSILTTSGGDMLVLCRTRQNVVAQSWSRDGGKTWGPLTGTEIPNPNSGTDALTLTDGRQLLVYNHTIKKGDKANPATYSSGRQELNVALSLDGRTWRPILTLEDDVRGTQFSYPAVIQTIDGKVHVTYTWNRKSIKHVTLDPTVW
ncbi:MAG: sialidase [Verrucomicrobia bacterium]|nr:MAG: sialidase [Verrucomicrobiota bacterium]